MYTYPLTKQKPFKEKRFNFIIKDDYRWLENINTIEVGKWISAQNTYTGLILDQHANVQKYNEEIKRILDIDEVSCPVCLNEYRFWTERHKGQQQFVLYYKKYSDQENTILVDPNGLNSQGTTFLDFYFPSPNGTYIAYGLSNGGSNISTLFIIDVQTKLGIFDIIPYAKHTSLSWLQDESGFYYTRYPVPSTVKNRGDENYYPKVYFHQLKTSYQHDIAIFGEGLPKDATLSLLLSPDNRYLFITVTHGFLYDDIYQYDAITKQIKPIIEGIKAEHTLCIENNTLYALTNYQAPKKQILSCEIGSIPSSFDNWTTIIPQSDASIHRYMVINGNCIVVYEKEKSHTIDVYKNKGELIQTLPTPQKGSINELTADIVTNTLYYSFSTFTTTHDIYKYQIDQNEQSHIHTSTTHIANDTLYIEESENLALMHKTYTQRDNSRPTVLFITSNNTPCYLGTWMPFIEHGGVFAMLSFDSHQQYENIIATITSACEKLKALGYTNANTCILYGSNLAALFILTTIERRPDICKAAICMNPITDLIHNPLFYIGEGAKYTSILQDPTKEEDLVSLLSYSPYHTLWTWAEYPSVLFCVGFNNHTISPANTYKQGALMQKQNTQNPILMYTNVDAGNDSSNSKTSQIQNQAHLLGFIEWQLGLS